MSRRLVFVAFLLLTSRMAAGTGDPTYAALRAARPDGRTVVVSAGGAGLVLERGAFRFAFEEGTFHLLAPVAGRTVGAVFLGRGSLQVQPAEAAERRSLALVSDRPEGAFASRFTELVLLFTDGTGEEILHAGPVHEGTPAPAALTACEAHLERQRREYRTNLHLRLLRDLLDGEGGRRGVFLAFLPPGDRLPAVLAAVDPAGAEALGLGQLLGGEPELLFVPDLARGGIWYQGGGRKEPERPAEAVELAVDTRIGQGGEIAGTAEIRLRVLRPALRVLPIRLLSELRLSAASAVLPADTAFRELPFVQEPAADDADAAVIFPAPLPAGAEVRLRLVYAGSGVLREAGEGTFEIGARQSWYPNFGTYADPALFTLTFRVPAGREVVAIGEKETATVGARDENGETVTVWRSAGPVRVAGFNYGRFRRLDRKDPESGITVEVYTNPGTPAIVRAIDEALRRAREAPRPGQIAGGPDDELTFAGPEAGRIDTSRLAADAAADGVNALRVFTTYFGPLPERRIALTQQTEWTFGQSWPSLVFLPYLAFLSEAQRAQLGLGRTAGFVEEVGFHEISHQWWGHLVGWSCYRDQWLSEGFAEFSAALALQHTQGWGRYGGFWEARRRQILERPAGGLAPWEAGPLTLGHRLTTARTPTGTALVYAKGAFVLHMLRMMLWDGGAAEPDGRFVALLKDYAARFAGKVATTADFQQVTEAHMVPAMDLAGDGTLGWFFRQWVEGTEIPRFRLDLKAEAAEGGVRVRGTVRQEEVGAQFRTILPLYLEWDGAPPLRFAQVPLTGTTPREVDVVVPTRQRPGRIRANLRHEVLARE